MQATEHLVESKRSGDRKLSRRISAGMLAQPDHDLSALRHGGWPAPRVASALLGFGGGVRDGDVAFRFARRGPGTNVAEAYDRWANRSLPGSARTVAHWGTDP